MNENPSKLVLEILHLIRANTLSGNESIVLQAITENKGDIDTIFKIGIACTQNNRFSDALLIFTCLQSIAAHDLRIPYNLGLIHALRGDHHSALKSYDLALQIQPDDIETLINKGSSCNDIQNYTLALEVLERAIELNPNISEAWSNKGIALSHLHFYEKALSAYEVAIKLNGSYFEAYSNKGVALASLKRYDEALAHYDKALSLKPDYAQGWSNKGNTLNELKRYDEALAHYDKALSLKPDVDWVYEDRFHLRMKICSWEHFQEDLKTLLDQVQLNQKMTEPFSLLSLTDNPLLQKQSAELYSQKRYPLNPILGPIPKRSKKEKIQVGYFSADFNSHAVSFLTAELFELHDRGQFEILAFSFGSDDKSLIRLRLSQAFDQFIDVSNMSDSMIAKMSRELGVDIAVDLGGHTAGSRAGIFACRAAPIQLAYIGYLGTTGAEFIDYLLADRTIIPDGAEKFYSEKIAYLPSYQVNDRKRVIANRKFTRQELGLPEDGFVFCCFNNNYKILPATFSGWMRILRASKDSVLFLYAESYWAAENLKKEAEARGVSSQRLIFGTRLAPDEYLARYQACDLFLDTAPYNAGATASDALWVGLPVLTLAGQSFASRVAASLLNAVDLPELVTTTQAEYESLAIKLATYPEQLAAIRKKLAEKRLATPLFDSPLFTKNLEAVFVEMYERDLLG